MSTQVAVFDFDRTLSSRDNVVAFLRDVAGGARVALALGALSPWIALSTVQPAHRKTVKAGLVRLLLRGRSAEEIDELARRLAAEVLDRHLHPEVVARAHWHREQGHELVITSASFATYLVPVGAQLGFDAVLATELEIGANGRLTGRLAGPNVRGAEKVRRLDAWLAGRDAFVWAYGDGRGDRELFARADRAVRVVRGRLPADLG